MCPSERRRRRLNKSAYILSTLTTDSTSELDVFRHDGDSLGVNGAQVGVFEESDEICLAGLLQSHDGRALEAQIGLEVLSDLADETLKRQLANQQLGALLVTADLTKSNGSRPVTMGLLHSAGSGRTLSGSLRCKLFSGSLASSRFTSCLLRTCHAALLSLLLYR